MQSALGTPPSEGRSAMLRMLRRRRTSARRLASRMHGGCRGAGQAMTDQDHRHLARADQRIAECEEQIERQHRLIERLLERGQETAWAKDMLEALQASLRAFEKHRQQIVSHLEAEK